MVQLYINMVTAGRITLAQVPELWRGQVAEAMGGTPEHTEAEE